MLSHLGLMCKKYIFMVQLPGTFCTRFIFQTILPKQHNAAKNSRMAGRVDPLIKKFE